MGRRGTQHTKGSQLPEGYNPGTFKTSTCLINLRKVAGCREPAQLVLFFVLRNPHGKPALVPGCWPVHMHLGAYERMSEVAFVLK